MPNPYFLKASPEKTCPRCLFTDDIVKIEGLQCEYCDLHDKLVADGDYDWYKQLDKIKRSGKKYNCLIGISGGIDSSTLLYMAVAVWGLKPLIIHMDNHYNVPAAEHNMKMLIQKLNVDAIRYNIRKDEYDKINEAFIVAGTADCDLANDVSMGALMLRTANQYGIKYILNGHSVYTEGSTPKLWTRIDSKYLESVYKWHTGKEIKNFPLMTFMDQIWYGIKGIKQIRPFHNVEVDQIRNQYEAEMKDFIGWQDYGGKHGENTYTAFIGSYLLPTKFNIDKRIVYLSALVRSGRMSREEATLKLQTKPEFDLSTISPDIISHIDSRITDRDDFKQYDFKKYKWVVFILYKIGIIPYSMFSKYCK